MPNGMVLDVFYASRLMLNLSIVWKKKAASTAILYKEILMTPIIILLQETLWD